MNEGPMKLDETRWDCIGCDYLEWTPLNGKMKFLCTQKNKSIGKKYIAPNWCPFLGKEKD